MIPKLVSGISSMISGKNDKNVAQIVHDFQKLLFLCSIASVTEQEVVWFTLDWKVPCVLFYSSVDTIDNITKDAINESYSSNPFIHVSINVIILFIFLLDSNDEPINEFFFKISQIL